MILHKDELFPIDYLGEHHYPQIAQFTEEVKALEASGWVMAPPGCSVWVGEEYGVPEGMYRVACDLYSPDDPETAVLRANRVDLQEKGQS